MSSPVALLKSLPTGVSVLAERAVPVEEVTPVLMDAIDC